MSTIETLEEIVGHSIVVENVFVRGDDAAKNELKHCLNIEREQFEQLAEDKKNDYMNGYDDKFPRIPMDVVRNATKKQNGKLVPAFAVYNVDGNGLCEVVNNTLTNISSKHGLSKFAGFWETAFWNVAKRVNNCPGFFVELPMVLSVFATFFSGMISLGLLLCKNHNSGFVFSHIFVPSILVFVVSCLCFALRDDTTIEHKFTHKFSGVIPNTVRQIIKDNKNKFRSIYLVEEGYAWKTETNISSAPRNVDPLIVGEVRNKHTGEMNYFLLAKFDVTPLENFIATELSA